MFSEEVLTSIRRQLNKNAPARLDMEDVFNAVRESLSKEAILEAGEISITKKKKKRKKTPKSQPESGQSPAALISPTSECLPIVAAEPATEGVVQPIPPSNQQ